MVSRLKFTKGHNSVKNVGGVLFYLFIIIIFFFFLFSAHHLMMLYICTFFMKIFQKVPELLSGHHFPKENFKGS